MSENWTVVGYATGRAGGPAPVIDPRYTCFPLRVAPSPIHRWGVFAGEPIPARRKVIEYTGEHLTSAQAEPRLHRPLHYLFVVDDTLTVDGEVGGSGAQAINHSCDPNLRIWVYKRHILLMSRRAIAAGEELTYDYQFRPSMLRNTCSCGSPKCRGSINPVL
jgi:uncharacterized protein